MCNNIFILTNVTLLVGLSSAGWSGVKYLNIFWMYFRVCSARTTPSPDVPFPLIGISVRV